MTLWLVAVIPTRWPVASRATIIRAPLYVLPEPGGPWIGRTVASSARPSRRGGAEIGLVRHAEVGVPAPGRPAAGGP